MEDNELTQQIEHLRSQLVELVSATGNFSDTRVIRLSQLLDRYIVEQQMRMARTYFKSTVSMKA